MSEEADRMDRMDEDFRGALADVVDGQTWAGCAGPGAAVRERGRRRRRRVAATSVAGTAVLTVAVALASVGLAGRSGPAAELSAGRVTTAGHGPYVKLADAGLRPADLGSGFTAGASSVGAGEFVGAFCSFTVPAPVVGPVVDLHFTGVGPDGDRLVAGEQLYQFADAASARAVFARARSAAQTADCQAGKREVSSVDDVGGVGDAMFVQRFTGGPIMLAVATVLVGQVVVVDDALPGSAAGVAAAGDWLTGVSQKAVARVRNAPRTAVPGDIPQVTLNPPFSPPHMQSPTTGASTASSLPVSQPVDGILFAPSDLGTSFGASPQDDWGTTPSQIPAATAVSGMMFRGAVAGGDREFLVNEGVYSFADASAARSGLAAYEESTKQPGVAAEPLSGIGDRAWIKPWGTVGGRTVAIQVGARVITFDVLAGGVSADQPIPGGDAWVRQIAQTAVQRLTAGK